MSQVLEPGQRALTPTEIYKLAIEARRIEARERRASMPKPAKAAKPARPFTDPLHLIDRGFTLQEATYHYAWERRHRMLDAYLVDTTLTYRRIGSFSGVGVERVRQLINQAMRERKSGKSSPVARYLNLGPPVSLAKLGVLDCGECPL